MSEAIEAAFWSAVRVTLVGSIIGQRQVSQVQVVDAPDGSVGGVALAFALTEEDQFEAVAVTVPGMDVARVILPPLRAEVGMLEVVARELVAVTGQSLPVLRCRSEKEQ